MICTPRAVCHTLCVTFCAPHSWYATCCMSHIVRHILRATFMVRHVLSVAHCASHFARHIHGTARAVCHTSCVTFCAPHSWYATHSMSGTRPHVGTSEAVCGSWRLNVSVLDHGLGPPLCNSLLSNWPATNAPQLPLVRFRVF